MRAGLLKETITIQNQISTKDIFGATSTLWIKKISTKAQVTNNSGNRINQNNEILHTYNKTFTIRLYHNVEDSDRILYKGKLYRIISIDREINTQLINIITELIND